MGRHPHLGRLHERLGSLYELHWRPVEAMASYRRAIEVEPTLGRARAEIAGLLLQEGKIEEALAEAIEAANLDPADPFCAGCVGRVLLERGEPGPAREWLRRACELEPRWDSRGRRPRRSLLATRRGRGRRPSRRRRGVVPIRLVERPVGDALFRASGERQQCGRSRDSRRRSNRPYDGVPAGALRRPGEFPSHSGRRPARRPVADVGADRQDDARRSPNIELDRGADAHRSSVPDGVARSQIDTALTSRRCRAVIPCGRLPAPRSASSALGRRSSIREVTQDSPTHSCEREDQRRVLRRGFGLLAAGDKARRQRGGPGRMDRVPAGRPGRSSFRARAPDLDRATAARAPGLVSVLRISSNDPRPAEAVSGSAHRLRRLAVGDAAAFGDDFRREIRVSTDMSSARRNPP